MAATRANSHLPAVSRSRQQGISRRKAHHDGLVSLETFERAQERLQGRAPIRLRLDYRPDFPLRGFVSCADCDHRLTASFSTGRGGRYPYYRCNNRRCLTFSKSIPGARMEEEFAELLKDIEPHPYVLYYAHALAYESWQERMNGPRREPEQWESERALCEGEIQRVAERAARTENAHLFAAYERRIADLEKRVQLLTERLERKDTSAPDFGTALKEVLGFVKSPYAVWDSGDLEHRRMLCTMAFEGPVSYCRENGFGTPNLSPGFALFRAIERVCFRDVRKMADTWNESHFNRCGYVRKAAANWNEGHFNRSDKLLQSDTLRRVLKNCQAAFERWVLDSYGLIQSLHRTP